MSTTSWCSSSERLAEHVLSLPKQTVAEDGAGSPPNVGTTWEHAAPIVELPRIRQRLGA